MLSKCRKPARFLISLLVMTVVISCCSANSDRGRLYFPEDDATEKAASVYASFAPIEVIQTGRAEEKQEIIAENHPGTPTRKSISENQPLLYCLPLSLCLASICIALLYAVTKAASANLFIIRYIQLSDGMK